MKIKVEPFLQKKGNRVAKAAIEFEEGILNGFLLVGFTICDDKEKGLFVLFPCAPNLGKSKYKQNEEDSKGKPFFFLRPGNEDQIAILESLIIDTYESMTAFNSPHVVETKVKPS